MHIEFQAQAVKEPLRRLAGDDLAGMLRIKLSLLFWRQSVVLCVNLTGFAVSPDVLL